MLEKLTIKKNIRSFSISPENLTGEKGGGGRAVVGSASEASRELGVGWKVNPYLKVAANSTVVLADYKGQGAIKHIWMTDCAYASRQLILRIYFDGQAKPNVEAPLSDFFCNADYKEFRQLSSLAICLNPAKGMNCYFEMPFFTGFRMEVENLGGECNIYYQPTCRRATKSTHRNY